MLMLSTSFSFFYSITPPTLQPTSQLFLTHLLYIFSNLLLLTFYSLFSHHVIFPLFSILLVSFPAQILFFPHLHQCSSIHSVTIPLLFFHLFHPFPFPLPPVNPPPMVPRINCQQFSLNDLNGTKIGQIISMLNPDNVVNLGVRGGAKSRREWGL